ncbi:hypothetical protein AB0J72_20850 [Dactylosporangium sp. NPDC049742]|uniref:hypothetical protein n=1 Tax=Dactylosporangium sp. NPDC049742 TaxID=3154737 RepID=UPI003437638D
MLKPDGRWSAAAIVASAFLVLFVSGCGDSAKTYDIGPLFPLTADKCQKYNGTEEGSGPFKKCWVTLEDCERAAADWAKATKNLPDAIRFQC